MKARGDVEKERSEGGEKEMREDFFHFVFSRKLYFAIVGNIRDGGVSAAVL